MHANRSALFASVPTSSSLRSSSAAIAPHLELDRAPDLDARPHRDRPVGLARAEHAADQEVTAPELRLVLVDDDADLQALGEEQPLVVRQSLGHFGEPFERRLAAELTDDVVVCIRDDVGAADRPASLRDHRVHAGTTSKDADGTLPPEVAVEREPVATRALRGRCHPADDLQIGMSSASREDERPTGT